MARIIRESWRYFRSHDLRSLAAALASRDAPPFIQFLKYAVCGAAALAAHTSIYLALIYAVWPHLNDPALDDWTRAKSTFPPTAIAFLFSNAFVYWLNTRWVFTPGRHSPAKEFLLFTAVNLPGALTGSLVQAALVYFLHWPKWAALAGFVLPNVLVNFACRKFFIFRR